MPSQIDPSRFADGQPVSKAELRAALSSAKAELEHGGFYQAAAGGGAVQRTTRSKVGELVSVKDFGAKGNDAADDTAAIQAAIDWALANGRGRVHVPAGVYRTTGPIWLDPPGNLRTSLASPTNFGFSLELVGEHGLSRYSGSMLRAADGSNPALIVGTGQGMRVADLVVESAVSIAHPKLHNASHVGIALCGGPGGSTRNDVERCEIWKFHTGVRAGYNADQLCDFNSLDKCYIHDCQRGVEIKQTQNCINSIIDCSITCRIAVQSTNGKNVNVLGGNFSFTGAACKRFSGVNASSATLTESTLAGTPFGGTVPIYSFSMTFTADTNLTNGVYDAFCLKTANFGLVPLELVSYSGGSGTFRIYYPWNVWHYGWDMGRVTATDLQADIRACTELYAAERIIVLQGTGFDVHGLHVENPACVTTLLESRANFVGDPQANLSKIYCNFNPTEWDFASSPSSDIFAVYACQATFPWIALYAGAIHVSDCTFQNTGDIRPLVIDIGTQVGCEMTVENTVLWNPTVRYLANFPRGTTLDRGRWGTQIFGAIRSDNSVQFGKLGIGTEQSRIRALRTTGVGLHPLMGYRPARFTLPYLNTTDVDAINANATLAAQPMVYGGAVYQTGAEDETNISLLAKSNHKMWSYGVDIPIDYSFKGLSSVVNLSGANLANKAYLFPGLIITIIGAATYTAVIKEVNIDLNYISVCKWTGGNDYYLGGAAATTYTGSSLGQEKVFLKRFGRQGEFGSSVAAFNGRTFAKGDIIWDTNPTAGGNGVGWICTTAGIVGNTAVFKRFGGLIET